MTCRDDCRPIIGPLVYYIQERTQRFHPGRWDQWCCCSPHYDELSEARRHFAAIKGTYWPVEVRLVRARFLYERVPIKTSLFANRGSQRRILSVRKLKVRHA